MFTGIIESRGRVVCNIIKKYTRRLIIKSKFDDLCVGESISVNGVCLTLFSRKKEGFLIFDVSPETLYCTTLKKLKVGDIVNLERAMSASGRFGGHYLTGHIDAVAIVKKKNIFENCVELMIGDFSSSFLPYVFIKGSIALDGVSLTINNIVDGNIKLMLIPHTLKVTTINYFKLGQYLNVEFDYLTRIVLHQLKTLNIIKMNQLKYN
ncbi:hypothetical protein CCU22_00020 [Candidatus Legionella polyplacis]|uniref:Riboflavin synthase n=1 Tax=Candidatus Legionella polyplacis TaxID=2005262 RepID=A0ABZ2GWP9_9GAMM|nr:riboflavin synthase [Candidatus Legionella polyplacis]ATW01627.1 hypothetical protein CCU22_00020 [Candidatus Legionella polyplacis]